MPDYTNVQEVLDILPKSVNSVSTVNSSTVSTFITHAEGIVNAKLAASYTVPVSPAPQVLKTISADITAFRLLRRLFTGEKRNVSEWPARYKDANELLDSIMKGQIQLLDSSGNIIEKKSSIKPQSNTEDYTPTFNEDSLADSIVDEDKLDDIEDDRDD